MKKLPKLNTQLPTLRLLNFMLVFALVGTLYLHFTLAALAPGWYGSIEKDQVNRINSHRATHGRAGLQHIECLNKIAEAWTLKMAQAGSISHNPNLGAQLDSNCGTQWSLGGENVGVGYDSAGLFNAFIDSPSHHENIDRASFTEVGVGAYVSSNGKLWITQVFAACSGCGGNWNTNATVPTDPKQSSPSSSSCPSVTTNSTAKKNGLQFGTKADFNGDGKSDVFWYGPGDVSDSIWYFNATQGSYSGAATDVRGTYKPVIADFNGDGNSDVFWYGGSTSGDSMWYGTTTKGKFRKGICAPVSGTSYNPLPGDFNGDGFSDIFWYGAGSIADYVWYGTGTEGKFSSKATDVSGTYKPVTGDFDKDGRSDILWYAGATGGSDSIWYGGSTQGSFAHVAIDIAGTSYVPVPGDFNGDGHSDVLWYVAGTGADRVSYFNATRGEHSVVSATVDGDYIPVPGDFNGDGKGDVFWYGPGGTSDAMWYGTATRGSFSGYSSVNVSGSQYLPLPRVNR